MAQERRTNARREIDKELKDMSSQALDLASQAMNGVSTHEKLCAERYGQIIKRMDRVELIIMSALGLLLAGNLIIKAITG